MGPINCAPNPADLKDKDGHTVSTDIEKANLLNNFFTSVFTKENTHQLPVFDSKYQGTPITQVI